jgi:hypothetical protein
LKEFPETDMVLISNEQKWKQQEIFSKKLEFENEDSINTFHHLSSEVSYNGNLSSKSDSVSRFSDGITYRIEDSLLKHKNSLLTVRLMAYTENLNSDAMLVVSFENKEKSYSYQYVNIKDFLQNEKKWTSIFLTTFVPEEIKRNDEIKCYLWNIGSNRIFIDDLELRINAYQK